LYPSIDSRQPSERVLGSDIFFETIAPMLTRTFFLPPSAELYVPRLIVSFVLLFLYHEALWSRDTRTERKGKKKKKEQ